MADTVAPSGQVSQADDAATWLAIRRIGVILATVVAVGLASYLIPVGAVLRVGPLTLDLDRLKPWVPGDDVPLASAFKSWKEKELPAFAGGGTGSYRSPEAIQSDVEARLGKAVARNLGEAAGVGSGSPDRDPTAVGGGSRGVGASVGGGGSIGGGTGTATPGVLVRQEEYEGIEVEIQDPGRRGMEPFYRALLATARGDAGALTRVGHYGDSSIATDLITFTVRRRLQQRFGDGGHGFILVARGNMPYRHRDVVHRADSDWQLRQLVDRSLPDGQYGYGGVQYRAGAGAHAFFGSSDEGPVGDRVSRFEVFFQRHSRGGRLEAQIDDGEGHTIDTSGAGDAFEVLDVADGPHSLTLRSGGGGEVRVYGVVLERDGPGVVYDSLGMVGARARRLLGYDATHVAQQISHRGTNLLVLGFGGNEASDPIGPIRENYESEFRRVIRQMRGNRRDLGCLVMAPLDQAERGAQGDIETLPQVPLIVEAQRRAALAEGCAFYDTFAAMGGEGAMDRWARTRPRLALSDYRHATPAGYEVIANLYYKALLKGFAGYLEQSGPH